MPILEPSLNTPDALPLSADLASAFEAAVRRASSVIIGTHLNPDGDALGSALAVMHYLDGIGVECEVVCHHPAPKTLLFLPGISRLRLRPVEEKHDLGIIVDLDSTDRLGDTEPYFAACDTTIVVDHHVPHEAPGTLRIVDTGAAATSAILTRLFIALKADITPAMATCMLTGIVTDTGSFRFRNTTPESLMLAGHLLACGADINQISEAVFQSRPAAASRLLGLVLEEMHLEAGNRIAWSVICLDDFARIGATDEDTEGFVNELLSIESVQIAALARETKPGKIRISLRSRRNIDVAEVARHFGGGGHKNAAGCTLEGEIEPAMADLVDRLKQCLASYS
jgi:phosphoesterase RecJ-like protein